GARGPRRRRPGGGDVGLGPAPPLGPQRERPRLLHAPAPGAPGRELPGRDRGRRGPAAEHRHRRDAAAAAALSAPTVAAPAHSGASKPVAAPSSSSFAADQLYSRISPIRASESGPSSRAPIRPA